MWQKLQLNFPKLFLAAFFVFAGLSVLFSEDKFLALKESFRLGLLIGGAILLSIFLAKGYISLKKIFFVIVVLAVLESGIGIAQFFSQSSIGLSVFNESVISSQIPGVAKIDIGGAKIVRAYGTFPHPNILAAFLIIGLISIYYFWIKSTNNESVTNKRIRGFLLPIAIFIVSLGLLFTFSRTAWVLAILASIALIVYSRNWRLAIIVSAIVSILFTAFNPYILSRAKVSVQEPSVSYRVAYNKMALEIIREKPFGVGIGNQVLYSIKNGLYDKAGLPEVWQKQPIHNIYLLITSEIGVLGGSAFLLFLISLLISNFKFLISKQIPITNYELLITIIMLLALLLFGLFDHFLWTFNPGRLMLWLVIGIIMSIKMEEED